MGCINVPMNGDGSRAPRRSDRDGDTGRIAFGGWWKEKKNTIRTKSRGDENGSPVKTGYRKEKKDASAGSS